MDELAQYNKSRWEALAQADIVFSRPLLNLTPESARTVVDEENVMGDIQGKKVLCLASGGGQQSVAFALLGAQVTLIDISETQLERDKEALAHYGVSAELHQGDMRDLSRFAEAAFDIVWHAYSINFVPDSGQVFDQVCRIIKPQGLYRLQWHNPFIGGVEESQWNNGYPLKNAYRDGEKILESPYWDVYAEDDSVQQVEGPREFNHTLSTVINGLIQRQFMLLGLWEDLSGDATAQPGTWEHFKAVLPPYQTLWARYMPDLSNE